MNVGDHAYPAPVPRPPAAPALAGRIRRAAARMAGLVAECYRAQRRLTHLRLQPDLYTRQGDRAPATYAEFLFRSPETLWHEPAAGDRRGCPPRQKYTCGR